jgi:carboxymethylenebutenolidase
MSGTAFRALLVIALISIDVASAAGASPNPEIVQVTSGALTLRALVWRPGGSGPFPAVVFNHGSYGATHPMPPDEPAILGPVFAHHGYVFLFLFRQGIGLSIGQGVADGAQMEHALRTEGQEARNHVQLQLLEGEELNEARTAVEWLRRRPEVDVRRIAVAGHSFGGSLSLLMAAEDADLRAAVIFGGAAHSWGDSSILRSRLIAAVRRTSVPIFFIHAANDYSTAPGEALAAEMQQLARCTS